MLETAVPQTLQPLGLMCADFEETDHDLLQLNIEDKAEEGTNDTHVLFLHIEFNIMKFM
jgi:hypothetical protein